MWKVSPAQQATLDGVQAIYLEVELPARVDPADCVDEAVSEYEAGPDGMMTTQSYRSRWWILEVNDQRFLVMARCYDTCTRGRPGHDVHDGRVHQVPAALGLGRVAVTAGAIPADRKCVNSPRRVSR